MSARRRRRRRACRARARPGPRRSPARRGRRGACPRVPPGRTARRPGRRARARCRCRSSRRRCSRPTASCGDEVPQLLARVVTTERVAHLRQLVEEADRGDLLPCRRVDVEAHVAVGVAGQHVGGWAPPPLSCWTAKTAPPPSTRAATTPPTTSPVRRPAGRTVGRASPSSESPTPSASPECTGAAGRRRRHRGGDAGCGGLGVRARARVAVARDRVRVVGRVCHGRSPPAESVQAGRCSGPSLDDRRRSGRYRRATDALTARMPARIRRRFGGGGFRERVADWTRCG